MTLEQFLTLYERQTGGSSQSYAKWMAQNGYTPRQDYNEALTDASRTYDRSLAGYGVTAEALGQMGLTDSGYSAYIDQTAKDRLAQSTAKAQTEYADTMAKAERGYAAYLRSQGSRIKSAISALNREGIQDYDTAYAYATAAGLDKGSATTLATYVANMTNRAVSQTAIRQRMSMLTQMVRLNLPKDVAYQYALSCGVTEDVAKELAEAAYAAQYPFSGDKTIYS